MQVRPGTASGVRHVKPCCLRRVAHARCTSLSSAQRMYSWRGWQAMRCAAQADVRRSDTYNNAMANGMNWSDPFSYHFDRGLYYHALPPHNLLCGTQPRNKEEVATLAAHERINTIISLQQDKDIEYWGVRVADIKAACESEGIDLIRCPAVNYLQARDFDPDDLRNIMPLAVQAVAKSLEGGKRVYVHCTAGLGRSPAVCIAYLYWFTSMSLDTAYKFVTDIRPCGPKRDAIRAATHDILGRSQPGAFKSLPMEAYAAIGDDDKQLIRGRVLA